MQKCRNHEKARNRTPDPAPVKQWLCFFCSIVNLKPFSCSFKDFVKIEHIYILSGKWRFSLWYSLLLFWHTHDQEMPYTSHWTSDRDPHHVKERVTLPTDMWTKFAEYSDKSRLATEPETGLKEIYCSVWNPGVSQTLNWLVTDRLVSKGFGTEHQVRPTPPPHAARVAIARCWVPHPFMAGY